MTAVRLVQHACCCTPHTHTHTHKHTSKDLKDKLIDVEHKHDTDSGADHQVDVAAHKVKRDLISRQMDST